MNRYLYYPFVLFVLLIALTISGCGNPIAKMYPGEEVSPDKRAAIKVTQWGTRRKVMYILSVDNKEAGNLFRRPGEVHVLPGRHNIVVEVCTDYTSYVTADLWLVAEAGECYIIKYLTKGYGAIMWLENERTGQPVGGSTGSDDELKQD